MAQVIELQSQIAESLGFHKGTIDEAAPVIYELGLHFGDVLIDAASNLDISREAFALALAINAAVLIDVATESLDEDAEGFYFRLIEASKRGLFDMPIGSPPTLKQLLQSCTEDNLDG